MYWIDYNPITTPFEIDNYAVIDVGMGGIIAYFNNENDAIKFINAKKTIS